MKSFRLLLPLILYGHLCFGQNQGIQTEVSILAYQTLPIENQFAQQSKDPSQKIVFEDKADNCIISVSKMKGKINMDEIRENLEPGTFFEIDEENNTFTTLQTALIKGKEYTIITAYVEGKTMNDVVRMTVLKDKWKKYKPIFNKILAQNVPLNN
jgi:hypothetical protein